MFMQGMRSFTANDSLFCELRLFALADASSQGQKARDNRSKGENLMRHYALWIGFAATLFLFANAVNAASIRGKVVDQAGQSVAGVMVSAIDDEHRKWTSVFSQQDGSFEITGLRDVDHNIRTRLMGLADEWSSRIAAGTRDLVIKTRPAEGEELEPSACSLSIIHETV
jgi:hypothetical protein